MSVTENGTFDLGQTTRLLSDDELDAVSGGIVGGQPVGRRIQVFGLTALVDLHGLAAVSGDGGRTWNPA